MEKSETPAQATEAQERNSPSPPPPPEQTSPNPLLRPKGRPRLPPEVREAKAQIAKDKANARRRANTSIISKARAIVKEQEKEQSFEDIVNQRVQEALAKRDEEIAKQAEEKALRDELEALKANSALPKISGHKPPLKKPQPQKRALMLC